MNRKIKLIAALCLLLIALPIVAGYFSYDLGYRSSAVVSFTTGFNSGNATGYEVGRDLGFAEGNSTGYSLGYELGFNGGNSSGYELGFNVGFAEGNRIGYVQGYEIGCNDGISSGYRIGYTKGLDDGVKSGFMEGNASGYSLGYVNGNFSGYETGYNFGYAKGLNDGAGSGFTVRNPTYQEMQNFIVADQTEQNSYIYPSYVCWNFAGDVKNNAFKAGFRCGFVYVSFPDSAHAMVCFQTIDRGLVFIEPQDDSIMSLVIGEHYWDRSKYIINYDDTVVRYGIIW